MPVNLRIERAEPVRIHRVVTVAKWRGMQPKSDGLGCARCPEDVWRVGPEVPVAGPPARQAN